MNTFTAILNSPLIVLIMSVLSTCLISATGAVIGLFIKVASLTSTINAIAKDVSNMANDKDIMRWSAWGPAHEKGIAGKEIERRR